MNPATADTLERSPALRRVVIASSALGMGMLLASLTVLSRGESGIQWHWSNLAFPAFALGATVAALYWRLVFRLGAGNDGRASRLLLYSTSVVLLLLGVAILLYPLRYVTPERRRDVLIGLAVAIAALSVVGFMMRTVVKMLEDEDDATPPSDDAR